MKNVRIFLLLLLPYLIFLTLSSSSVPVEVIEVQCVEYVYIKEKPQYEILATKPIGLPVNMSNATLTSGFGYRLHPVHNKYKMHKGIDLACKVGTPVTSTAYGKVIKVENKPNGYGLNIVISHAQYRTRYAHLSSVKVKEGQIVALGDTIGNVGRTGTCTGPHLHYEVIKHNSHKNPTKYF